MNALEYAVDMRGIVKTFPGVVANDNVDLQLERGKIHALLGENGAGKTTLMNVLYGLYRPDGGEILVGDKRVVFNSPQDAIAVKIGMIHQHFMLVQAMSVVDNIILGLKSNKVVLDEVSAQKRIRELADTYGLEVDPDSYIWQLSVGEQQRVEILKAIYRDASILILDEPTAVLTPPEIKDLFRVLRRMKGEGKSIVYISHKLDEVLEISDRISVLRLGKIVAEVLTKETSKVELARMMVGREVIFRLSKTAAKTGKPILEVQDISAVNDRKALALRKVSFTVGEGEILGIAGVSGNGQRELAEVLIGLRKVANGNVKIGGVDVTNSSPRKMADMSVGFIPEDRVGVGLVMNLPILNNAILKEYRNFSNGPLLDYAAASAYTERIIKEFGVKTPNMRYPTKTLSGGNLQKLILARELARDPRLLIASQPTRGLDVGATEEIRSRLIEERSHGRGVLLISEDLDEILSLSDRIAVMFEGQIMGIVQAEDAKLEDIGLMMAGSKRMEA
jgi:simple sugar transport system ATP-binding protein